MRILIIDNYDSFTFNLYQYIGELLNLRLGAGQFEVWVKRNNQITLQDIQHLNPDKIIISPGPGSPDDPQYFGVCGQVILELGKTRPVLGVCLGMQGIAHYFGGKVIRAPIPMHGKTSIISHDGRGLYQNIPQHIDIMRYHSLMVEAESLPDELLITSVVGQIPANASLKQAALEGAEIMGLRHSHYPIEGIQYHPESFATEGGKALLANFLFK